MAGGMYRRDSVASAQLSIPYGVALGLCGRSGRAQDFEAGVIGDEELFRLAQAVRTAVSKEMEAIRLEHHKSAARVEVLYRDGSRELEEVRDARGHQDNPLGERDVIDKFTGLAAGFRAGEIAPLVLEGDPGRSAEDLFRLL
jgi:2-methylcitrate dehydratase PrpD